MIDSFDKLDGYQHRLQGYMYSYDCHIPFSVGNTHSKFEWSYCVIEIMFVSNAINHSTGLYVITLYTTYYHYSIIEGATHIALNENFAIFDFEYSDDNMQHHYKCITIRIIINKYVIIVTL